MNMNIPEYLHPHVAQLLAIETETAILKQYWAVVLGLKPFRDGNEYCFLWGSSPQDGVCGFGKSVSEAMKNFDKAMNEKLPDAGDNERLDK